VIATRIPALQETLADAAILLEPVDVDGLARAIIEILEKEERSREMSSSGLKQAAKYSWEKAAALTYEIYRQVASA
jgi:alpha-1,3-rhamnosyl/mannosyltransferase